MGKNNNRIILPFDRNKAVGPWQPLQPMPISEENAKQGIVAAFINPRYTVGVKRTISPGLAVAGPDGQGRPAHVIHLIINHRAHKQPPWEDLMRIKGELVHEEAEAVELFPAVSRLLDMKQTHLWVIEPGIVMPLGLFPQPTPSLGSITREDVEFYVVETPDGENTIREVFASEEDATSAYAANGNALPEKRGVCLLAELPMEEDGGCWSPAAIERRVALMAKIEEAGKAMAAKMGPPPAEVLPDGPASTEEQMAADGELEFADAPRGPEEGIHLAEAMERGIAAKLSERDAALTAEVAAAKEAGNEEAEADLRRMREEFVKTGTITPKPSDDGGQKTE